MIVIPTVIKTDLISQLSPTGSVAPVAPITATPNLRNSLLDFVPGQKYLALVEARLPNGNARVLISDQLLQMRLPGNISPGDQMELVFISKDPRLKFLLHNDGSLKAGNNNASISATGRFLGVLAQDAQKPTTSQPLTSTTPILPAPPLNSLELPGLLQKAIFQSGLFYESHQAQWVAGKNKLVQLQQEPQGKLVATAITKPTISNLEMPVHAQSVSLVQQQLSTLETGQITWRGEIWQGQPMQWDITEHPPSNEQETNETSQWRTQLKLTLPQLGDITANMILSPHGLSIKLNTTETETASLLKKHQSPLTTGMTSAGLNVQAVEVQHDVKE